MKKLIDVVCSQGHIAIDVYTPLDALPACACGAPTERAWAFVRAPGITPNGTRPERNTDKPRVAPKVDTAAIAVEKTFEVEQKWLRYGSDSLAEQHVSREINHAAGIADELGNPKPIPKPAPIVFEKPAMAACAV